MNQAEFDEYAGDYEAQLNRGLSASGEDRSFFARGRIAWLSRCLKRLQFTPGSVLDYGCGTGAATPFFLQLLGATRVVGVDVSAESLRVAQSEYAGLPVEFRLADQYQPDGAFDLAFCNGVFHHVPVAQRRQVAQSIADSLRPGGLFAFWENNPWNPGTRYIMSRVAFDKDAIPLTAGESRAIVRQVGLRVLRTDYCFIFPRFLRAFRPLEPLLAKMPLGGQHQVLAVKPD